LNRQAQASALLPLYLLITGHLSSMQTVFLWNKEQLNAMRSGQRRVILDSEFGCGKTFILKSFALHLARHLRERIMRF
jgi:tRNA A37 threonylcarbamoyladenosine biosynthesis protein TsaE